MRRGGAGGKRERERERERETRRRVRILAYLPSRPTSAFIWLLVAIIVAKPSCLASWMRHSMAAARTLAPKGGSMCSCGAGASCRAKQQNSSTAGAASAAAGLAVRHQHRTGAQRVLLQGWQQGCSTARGEGSAPARTARILQGQQLDSIMQGRHIPCRAASCRAGTYPAGQHRAGLAHTLQGSIVQGRHIPCRAASCRAGTYPAGQHRAGPATRLGRQQHPITKICCAMVQPS